jgi:hypothetical protein
LSSSIIFFALEEGRKGEEISPHCSYEHIRTMVNSRPTGGGQRTVNTAGIIDDLVKEVVPEGIYSYTDLITTAREKKIHGIGISGTRDGTTYLLFVEGEPEGAIIADSKGELYGNKAVYLISEKNRFTLYPLSPAVVEQFVYGCRIYNKSHFKGGCSLGLPEIGKKTEGIGRLIISVRKDGSPAPGLPIKIRSGGQIVGSDITDRQGMASFRLMFGSYSLIVVREENSIDVYEFTFRKDMHEKPQELDVG